MKANRIHIPLATPDPTMTRYFFTWPAPEGPRRGFATAHSLFEAQCEMAACQLTDHTLEDVMSWKWDDA